MDLSTALAVFRELESHRYEDDNDPIFDVRLDAGTNRENFKRCYRIRVTPGGGVDHYHGGSTLEMVTSVATAFGVTGGGEDEIREWPAPLYELEEIL